MFILDFYRPFYCNCICNLYLTGTLFSVGFNYSFIFNQSEIVIIIVNGYPEKIFFHVIYYVETCGLLILSMIILYRYYFM